MNKIDRVIKQIFIHAPLISSISTQNKPYRHTKPFGNVPGKDNISRTRTARGVPLYLCSSIACLINSFLLFIGGK